LKKRTKKLLSVVLLLIATGQPGWADSGGAELDRLFAALKAAPGEAEAAALEAKIRAAWLRAGSPAVLLLLNRGAAEVEQGDPAGALDTLDDALVLAPDYAEAWLARAVAKFHAGDTAGAIRDVQATLRREPRHFLAWQTLSRIAEAQEDWKGALAAWEKAMEIDPHMPQGQERLQTLRRKALGEST
jgi:tetratricopeptide (TPR) repeat protein